MELFAKCSHPQAEAARAAALGMGIKPAK